MTLKLWHDDIRRPPNDEDWIWARTNQEAMFILITHDIEEASLDHDLGLHYADPDLPDADLGRGWDQENDGCTLIRAMIKEGVVPPVVTIHSWNPPGAQRMAAMLRDVGVAVTIQPYARV